MQLAALLFVGMCFTFQEREVFKGVLQAVSED